MFREVKLVKWGRQSLHPDPSDSDLAGSSQPVNFTVPWVERISVDLAGDYLHLIVFFLRIS